MSRTILVVEDEPGIRMSVKDELESLGYLVYEAEDGQSALDVAITRKPDLIILDVMLPVLNGHEVCRTLRAAGDRTPIIMLTVRDRQMDKVLGLEIGADDYLTKPFGFPELTARVKALLRRTDETADQLGDFHFGDVALDFRSYEVTKGGRRVDLTTLELKMLRVLVRNLGKVVTRSTFLQDIWGRNSVNLSTRTVDSHIANIRRKVEDNPADPKHILSIRSAGYKLVT
jgi:two-component system, OmpR family, alkaline phosphatase synthesis response regulator PhoP